MTQGSLERLLGEPGQKGNISLCALLVGDIVFGIETRMIKEVLGKRTLRQVPHAPSYIAGIVLYHGEVLTTVSGRALLGLPSMPGESCVVVLQDAESGDRFGFVVDAVAGVIVLDGTAYAQNPPNLDERSALLYDGVFRRPDGLLVHLTPKKLRPARLGGIALFRDPLTPAKYPPINHAGEVSV